MPGTIMTRSHVPFAYLPNIAMVAQEKANKNAVYKEIVELKDSSFSPDKRQVTTAFVTNFGPLQDWTETGGVPFDMMDPGRTKTTAYADFGIAGAVSRNAVEDELFGIFDSMGEGLQDSHTLFRNLNVAGRMLNNAYNTTYFTDDSDTAKALLATDHGSVSGASRPNILGTSESLSYESFQKLQVLLWQHKNEKGYEDPALEDDDEVILMVSPADGHLAEKIAGEASMYEPSDNYASPNVIKRTCRVRVVRNPYLNTVGAGNYWFLIVKSKKGIYIVERRAPEISNYKSPDNKAMIVDLTCREAVHVQNIWGYWGSGN